MELWIAEKRGVAEKIAAALGVERQDRMHIATRTGAAGPAVIAWCEGHLLQLAEPDAYDPSWKAWSLDVLPMIPDRWRMAESDLPRRKALLAHLSNLIQKATSVVIATDAGREGETIAREVLAYCGYRGPVLRFWGKAETPAGIRAAVADLRQGSETLRLYHAGKARGCADWLVGLNATRLATLQARTEGGKGPLLSIGRVQSPTLALIVRRDRSIEGFVPVPFWDVHAMVPTGQEAIRMKVVERFDAAARAEQAACRLADAHLVLGVKVERKQTQPPKPFSLGLLQQAANRLLRWSLKRTQDVAQILKDKGYITYHRTDSTHLEETQAADMPAILQVIAAAFPKLGIIVGKLPEPVIRKSVFDSAKVSDHPAITPTLDPPPANHLTGDELALYELICARTLACVCPDHVYDAMTVTATHDGLELRARGRSIVRQGWRAVLADDSPSTDDDEVQSLPALQDGSAGQVAHTTVTAGMTKPDKRYTEGSLAADMVGIGKYATDPKIKARLRESSGIGRPSTHHTIIETLIARRFVERDGVHLTSTKLGRALVDALLPELTEPTLTALWEDLLLDIEAGKGDPRAFMDQLRAYVVDLVRRMQARPMRLDAAVMAELAAPPARTPTSKPTGRRGGRNKRGSTAAPHPAPARSATPRPRETYDAGERPRRGVLGSTKRRPSDRALAYAKELAEHVGVMVDPDVDSDASACTAFIDRLKSARAPARLMERALRLAKQAGKPVPKDTFDTVGKTLQFISANRAKRL